MAEDPPECAAFYLLANSYPLRPPLHTSAFPHSIEAEPLARPLPSWQLLTRQMGVNLGLLSSDMSFAGEGGGFLELARVLSVEVCPNASWEQAKV